MGVEGANVALPTVGSRAFEGRPADLLSEQQKMTPHQHSLATCALLNMIAFDMDGTHLGCHMLGCH